ncbi:hypothetical protein ASG12_07270 [Williamsia sp. Leaf354]|uniref:glycosyltransferase family 2 protein n=1 Tax=Williamsia sp. Leaf354 TaxID=1736349 RepID=UPI0006FEB58B|nr:glycosyltransferase family A protein [Williamsia sp. Leaf354]KQS00658.1 hypothetical protein ASG12_07270 [Williamsia sp. Leaf354]
MVTATGAPTVSVICPTHNRSTAILPTIASVRAQTFRDWQLVVVSDGSTDDTDAVVAEIARADDRVLFARIDHHGHPSPARNAGIDLTDGPIVAYLDHDDRWHPEHLQRVVDVVTAGADLVATGGRYVDTAGATTFATSAGNAVWHPEMQLLGPMFEPSRFAHRRDLLARCGPWKSGPGVEDWDLLLRMSDAGARVATLAGRTVDMLTSTSARRGRILLRHHIPLATFATARLARAAADRLTAPDATRALHAAYTADVTAWFDRLRDDPRLVLPLDADADVALDDLRRTRHDPVDLGPLAVVADRGRYSVAQPVACVTADHAARITAAAQTIRTHHRRVIADLCGDLDTTTPEPAVRPAPLRATHVHPGRRLQPAVGSITKER